MEIISTPLSGLLVVQLKLHGDERGFFVERFNEGRFKEKGLPSRFVQDNHSRSAPGILRGLHYQSDPAQGKLVGAIRGRIWDVAVDLRPGSPTRGQHFALELNDTEGKLLWIPTGFAHGFCVLGNQPADVLYKVTTPYEPKSEGGIRWNDPDLDIPWPICNPILSKKDELLASYRISQALP